MQEGQASGFKGGSHAPRVWPVIASAFGISAREPSISILKSEDFARTISIDLYMETFGRQPTTSELESAISICVELGRDAVAATILESDAFHFDQAAEDPRLYTRSVYRLTAGEIATDALDELVTALQHGRMSRAELVRRLMDQPQARVWQARRLWLRLSGKLEMPAGLQEQALSGASYEDLIKGIIERSELEALGEKELSIQTALRRIIEAGLSAFGGDSDDVGDLQRQLGYLQNAEDIAFLAIFAEAANTEKALSRLHGALCDALGASRTSWDLFKGAPTFQSLFEDGELPEPGSPRLGSGLENLQAAVMVKTVATLLGVSPFDEDYWIARLKEFGDLAALSAEMIYRDSGAELFAALRPRRPPQFTPVFGPFVGAANAAYPTRRSGQPTIATTYFYWYDSVGAPGFLENPDNVPGMFGQSALTHRPIDLDNFTYQNIGLHEREFRDMAAAGVDIALPVYFGSPLSAPEIALSDSERSRNQASWFSDWALRRVVEARENLVRLGQPCPFIGLFYDTSSAFNNATGWHLDVRGAIGRRWIYETWRNFFSQVPRRHWACIDGRPVVFVYHPAFIRWPPQDMYDVLSDQFEAEFGVRPFVVTAAEQDAVQINDNSALVHVIGRVQAGDSLEVLINLLDSDEVFLKAGRSERGLGRYLGQKLFGSSALSDHADDFVKACAREARREAGQRVLADGTGRAIDIAYRLKHRLWPASAPPEDMARFAQSWRDWRRDAAVWRLMDRVPSIGLELAGVAGPFLHKTFRLGAVPPEGEAFFDVCAVAGRHRAVRQLVGSRAGVRGVMAYVAKRWLHLMEPIHEVMNNVNVVSAADVALKDRDLMSGYIDILASDAFYEAAGGLDTYFIDYLDRQTTQVFSDRSEREADLTALASMGRAGFVRERMRRHTHIQGMMSHWYWWYLGRFLAGLGDSEFYWSGAIEPMFHPTPSIGPGYDQSALRTRPALVAPRDEGRRYTAVWENLLAMSPRPWLVHLETWNEFFEGTDICETADFGRQYIDLTRNFADIFHGHTHWSRTDITEPDLHKLSPIIRGGSEPAPQPSRDEDVMPQTVLDDIRELQAAVAALNAMLGVGPPSPAPQPPPASVAVSDDLFPYSPLARGVVYEPDVYRSYEDEDISLLERFARPSSPVRGCFTDFLGRITDCRFLPSIAHLEGKASSSLPVPGDGFYADTIEYIGLLRAYESLTRDQFVAAEFGGGWGPWTAAAGVIGRSRGVRNIELVGVEASAGKIELMKKHLLDNGLRPASNATETRLDGVHVRCVRGAVWTEDGEVRFPNVIAEQEYGSAVAQDHSGIDYRGIALEYEAVPSYTIATLLNDYNIVDFIHIDIQGAEASVCSASIEFLKERARYIFIGTHSRTIEGQLVCLFNAAGFELLREKPCRFAYTHWSGTLEGATTADGGQLWKNPRQF